MQDEDPVLLLVMLVSDSKLKSDIDIKLETELPRVAHLSLLAQRV